MAGSVLLRFGLLLVLTCLPTTAHVHAQAAAGGAHAQQLPPATTPLWEVRVDWTATPTKVASTASTVEVDVMPFLGRTPEGGPFDGYFEALSNLGSDFVRYAPCKQHDVM